MWKSRAIGRAALIAGAIAAGCADAGPFESTRSAVGESCDGPEVHALVAGQTREAGSVTVVAEDGQLVITIATSGDWMIGAYHVYAGTGPVPANRAGNYAPGRFPYKADLSEPVAEVTLRLPLAGLVGESAPDAVCGATLQIAVHTDLRRIQKGIVIETQTGWAFGSEPFSRHWGWSFSYAICCPPPDLGCVRIKGSWRETPQLWPIDEMTLGGVLYTKDALVQILYTVPGAGDDASLRVAHQLIAAELNEADGAYVDPVTENDMMAADDWLSANMDADGLLPFGTDAHDPDFTAGMALADSLFAFNSGERDTPSCDPQWR
jgi:hypothetical protein